MLFYILVFLPILLEAVTKHERYWEEQSFKKKAKGFGIHTDVGYSSYLIELHSSEMDSAIDYDVLETSIGFSYVKEKFLVGAYTKFVSDEIKSNMYVVTTQAPLNNWARIDKDEFALYANYILAEGDKSSWAVNSIYRYANLNASDAYDSFFNYISYFEYQTDGVALSLAYQRGMLEKGMLVSHIGLLYSKAEVSMSESINGHFQDSFVDDSVNALGFKASLAYNYAYSKNLSLHFRTDIWKQQFNSLAVKSRVGDTLPSASLKEQSYTTYFGVAWKF
ncbi:MAG: Unknown protein [uncultured Sulfurovum sp.]|uniref:Uncharacterized protein n=1 Tax=uncultured Sulfurovum sp. TaxID=269237 RepID=A0A6S6TD96_9BACT|nr:MAG: Unknown protein [uncultured Sulfurovum sp.]